MLHRSSANVLKFCNKFRIKWSNLAECVMSLRWAQRRWLQPVQKSFTTRSVQRKTELRRCYCVTESASPGQSCCGEHNMKTTLCSLPGWGSGLYSWEWHPGRWLYNLLAFPEVCLAPLPARSVQSVVHSRCSVTLQSSCRRSSSPEQLRLLRVTTTARYFRKTQNVWKNVNTYAILCF